MSPYPFAGVLGLETYAAMHKIGRAIADRAANHRHQNELDAVATRASFANRWGWITRRVRAEQRELRARYGIESD